MDIGTDLRTDLRQFLVEEDAIGVIEVVLILVVLIGLVIIFKEINNQSKEVY